MDESVRRTVGGEFEKGRTCDPAEDGIGVIVVILLQQRSSDAALKLRFAEKVRYKGCESFFTAQFRVRCGDGVGRFLAVSASRGATD